MHQIKSLFREQPPKATWRRVLSGLVNFDVEPELGNFRDARRLAQQILALQLSAYPTINERPSVHQAEESIQALLQTIGDDEAKNILEMNLNPPAEVHEYRMIQQFEGHRRKPLIPQRFQSFEDFMAWFSYELPLGGQFNQWTFFQHGLDVIVKHESLNIAIMSKMVWKLFCPTLLAVGIAFLVHFVVSTYGVSLPSLDFFGARQNDTTTSLHPAATLIATLIASMPLVSNFNEEWMYTPKRHVLITVSLAASSTLAILANFSEQFWWMIGAAMALALFALAFGWRRSIMACCGRCCCNCCRRR